MLRLPDHVRAMWPNFLRAPPEWLQAEVATEIKRANTVDIYRASTTAYIINRKISVIFDDLYRHPVFCRREELNEYWVPHSNIDTAEDE